MNMYFICIFTPRWTELAAESDHKLWGDVWEKQSGVGSVRPHECGLVCLGFVVPAWNWNAPCTYSARKNDKI